MIGEEYFLHFSPTTQGFQFQIDRSDEPNNHEWVTIAKGSEEKLTLFIDAISDFVRIETRLDVIRLWRVFECGYQRRFIE